MTEVREVRGRFAAGAGVAPTPSVRDLPLRRYQSETLAMNSGGFLHLVDHAFAPFLMQLGFIAETPRISGREYGVEFVGASHRVVVSYDPGTSICSWW